MFMETDTFTFQAEIASGFDPEAEIVLYHGDVMDLLSNLFSKFAKLLVTSPPYNMGKECETRVAVKVTRIPVEWLNQEGNRP